MKISIPENIGDDVILSNDAQGKIISIHIGGPHNSVTYEISWWDEGSYKASTFWRFEFSTVSNDKKKAGFGHYSRESL